MMDPLELAAHLGEERASIALALMETRSGAKAAERLGLDEGRVRREALTSVGELSKLGEFEDAIGLKDAYNAAFPPGVEMVIGPDKR